MFIIVGWIHFAPAKELAILLVERIYARKKNQPLSTGFAVHVLLKTLRYELKCNTQCIIKISTAVRCHQWRSCSNNDMSKQRKGVKLIGLTLNLGKLQLSMPAMSRMVVMVVNDQNHVFVRLANVLWRWMIFLCVFECVMHDLNIIYLHVWIHAW